MGVTLKRIRRTLFSRINPYPQKKIMTFNKHVKDFTFNVNYADLDYLGETEVAWLGSNNITSVLVKGVKEALEENAGENMETKGVKAHFALDDSGILSVSSIESVFEKTISVEEQEKKEKEWKEATDGIDWSKLGDNIKSFFGTDEKKEGDDTTGENSDDKSKEEKKEKSEDKKDDTKKSKEPSGKLTRRKRRMRRKLKRTRKRRRRKRRPRLRMTRAPLRKSPRARLPQSEMKKKLQVIHLIRNQKTMLKRPTLHKPKRSRVILKTRKTSPSIQSCDKNLGDLY